MTAARPRCSRLAGWFVLACLALGAAAVPVLAQPLENRTEVITAAPVATPAQDDLRPEIKDLLPQNKLIGKGRLTYWGFQVYDARLWATPGFRADNLPAQPFALELDYLRGFDNAAVADRSIAEMRRSASISEAQAKAWTAEMLRVIPDVKKGDRVMGINRPGMGALFLVNGKPSGEIRDTDFARLFFGIWLSPKTSEPKLRSALLAGAP